MEVLLILLGVAVVGFFIYQSLPSTKFSKANELASQSKYEEAIAICQQIFDKIPDAPAKLAECKLKQGLNSLSSVDNALRFFIQVLEIKKRLVGNSNKPAYEKVEAKAGLEVAKINFERIKQVGQPNSHSGIEETKRNLNYIHGLCKVGIESDFKSLIEKHNLQLSGFYYSVATDEEKRGNIDQAIQCYSNLSQLLRAGTIQYSNAETRIAICYFKKADSANQPKLISDSYIFEKANKASTEIKNDFYYRHAINLIKCNKIQEAESIISTKIAASCNEIDKLRTIIKNFKIKDATKKVEQLNQSLDELNANGFPVESTRSFYDSFDKAIHEINIILPDISSKLLEVKPSIFNKLLSSHIEGEQFGNAINLILKYPEFWESPELLKNLGICCFGFTQQGKLDDKVYKIIISTWLTAVFSDKVILKSLENTSWDDDYTFTLANAIGSNYQSHNDLPENVNYDEPHDSNISIGSTQRELLQLFESSLNSCIKSEQLAIEIHDFYSAEKEALEKVVSIIPDDIFFASPHFAKYCNIHDIIIKALDDDYRDYSNEEALEAGLPYLKGPSKSCVADYNEVKLVIEEMIDAINKSNLQDFSKSVTDSRKKLFSQFSLLSNSVEDEIFNAFHRKIEDNPSNERLIPIFEQSINFCPNTSKLKYQYSNFVTALCVSKVNDSKMTFFKALEIMKKAYLFSPDNSRVCTNIVTLIKFNLLDIINNDSKNSLAIYKILDEIHPKRSKTFIQSSKELSDSRKEILAQLKKAGADISLLTEETNYLDLLAWNTNRKTLTAEGEKMKKAILYMKMLSDNVSGNLASIDRLSEIRKLLGQSDNLPF